LPNTAVLFPDWKQEINRRVAAHKSARGASQAASAIPTPTHQLGHRAAKAAASVAARYATAPSYSEMLAREARAAMDAAKAAAKAAEEAQAAFQFVLDGLEAAPAESECLPERVAEPVPISLTSDLLHAIPEPATHADTDQPAAKVTLWESEVVDATEAAASEQTVQPIYANLIEFPRPMVAARRARPRLAEGPLAASDSAPQLSIFEVEPTAISTVPPAATEDLSAPPSWMRTQWPESIADEWPPARDSDVMPLARHYASTVSVVEASIASPSVAPESTVDAHQWEELSTDFRPEDEAATRSASALSIEVAPLSRRLLAVVVDSALAAAILVLGAFVAMSHVGQLPGMRVIALGTALAFFAAVFAYHACFFMLFRSTPGMLYAGIEIDMLSGAVPARRCRWIRLMSMLLSLLPLGLGFVWALFDDDNLAWHDRLSGTYLRRR
jgi:uncharacterized RDD family membrane protein YckC